MPMLHLTHSQVMALRDIVLHYITSPGHKAEVFIDITRRDSHGNHPETRPEDFFTLLDAVLPDDPESMGMPGGDDLSWLDKQKGGDV